MSDKSPSPSAPNAGRFSKGRSGNPGGRPRASRAVKRSAFDIVLERKFTVAHGAGTREITAEEAHQRGILRDALAGNRSAIRDVVKWIMRREAWLAKHAPKVSGPPISLISSPDPDNADAPLRFWRSQHQIPPAQTIAGIDRSCSLNRGQFRRHCDAGVAAIG
jgi:hypothetical protein